MNLNQELEKSHEHSAAPALLSVNRTFKKLSAVVAFYLLRVYTRKRRFFTIARLFRALHLNRFAALIRSHSTATLFFSRLASFRRLQSEQGKQWSLDEAARREKIPDLLGPLTSQVVFS